MLLCKQLRLNGEPPGIRRWMEKVAGEAAVSLRPQNHSRASAYTWVRLALQAKFPSGNISWRSDFGGSGTGLIRKKGIKEYVSGFNCYITNHPQTEGCKTTAFICHYSLAWPWAGGSSPLCICLQLLVGQLVVDGLVRSSQAGPRSRLL